MDKKIPIIIVVLVVIGLGYWFYSTDKNQIDEANLPHTSPVSDQPSSTATSSTTLDIPLEVNWHTPEKIASLNFLSDEYDSDKETLYYDAGTINSGKYKDGRIVVVITPPVELQDGELVYRFVDQNSHGTLLTKNSSYYKEIETIHNRVSIDDVSIIPELIYPDTISHNGIVLNMFLNNKSEPMLPIHNLALAFVDPKLGNVYTDIQKNSSDLDITKSPIGKYERSNGFYLQAPDGTVRIYYLKIPWAYTKDYDDIAQVTWSDGSKNNLAYTFTAGNDCGQSLVVTVNGISDDRLIPVGKNFLGDVIYGFSNPNDPILKQTYATYVNERDPQQNISYSSFSSSRPVFFWRDPFGRLVRFLRSDFLIGGGCGKPVIYLYPEKTENVSVQILLAGKLTKTDPPYVNGWNVLASPDGKLIDMKSGKSYPYLFWEGEVNVPSTSIPRSKLRGFVVKADDIHDFLKDKLAQFGLNEKEIVDFMEFWEPRITGAPYFYIKFFGNQYMDKIAPLVISPRPDTVIRILMDFIPLDHPISVQNQQIIKPERKGFTVVEWGGVLR